MSRSIKTFTIKYNSINEHNTFTNGDTIQGRIILELSKELRIDKLFIKCKGGADVHWTESSSSSRSDSYSSHQRYFKLKQIFIWDNSKIGQDGSILLTNWEKYGNLIMPGHHTFPFSFQLPETNMPPSFKGSHGSIKYVLEAKLHRSWKIPETVVKEFTFVSKVPDTCALLMQPLSGSVEQKMKFFTSGSASIKASTDKKGYMQGERIKVETHIENSSSRALKLKFKLKQKQTFTAQSRHNYATKVIFKAVEDPIPSRSKKTFTSRLKLPSNLDLTITNCSIISVEYFLKVYLDVPYDIDPYIVFPLVIIPAGQYSIPQQNQVDYQASFRGSVCCLQSLPLCSKEELGVFSSFARCATKYYTKMSTVKQLSLTYDAVNSSNTFTNGDVINGRVVFEVTKEVTIESLYIKCKGDARVKWSERRNDKTYSYSANERYFKIKQYFIKDPKKGNEDPGVILAEGEIYSNVVKPGNHVYPFSFQLPHGNFPASFKGHYGSVKYILEVTLDRSWKMDRTETKEFIFVPRLSGVNLMSPQTGSIEKKMKLFTSGSTSMKATIDKMAFMRGEVMKVSTDIDNSSSRDLKIKYSMEQKQTFHAQGHSKYSSRSIFKVVGDPVPAGSKQTINTNLTLPENLEMTITNCNIIKLEYIFKVYLDVPYASDPEICFSVIILPAGNIFVPVQNQPAFQPNGIPIGPGWNQPLPQPEFGPIPPGATFGPAPGFHPGPYPSPAYSNPVDPPPSYADLYTNPNATAPGFNQALSAPSAPPPYNPQYPLMGYPNPGVPQQPQVPSAPQFCPGPDGPGCVPAEAPPGYWPNPTTQPEPYPTKSPGKHE
ncbi:hypothetical protein HF521_014625 [Silurus meridionalis]|uniref:Arrestin C-terminal-like domain-containing protein n=1 Tax=Silurus meridionalis TaxID=175797 RepID=A0A8T0A824_SILME|nr:hypothetical protein HF521_014625 [Silurus meridionalis]